MASKHATKSCRRGIANYGRNNIIFKLFNINMYYLYIYTYLLLYDIQLTCIFHNESIRTSDNSTESINK